MARPPRLEFPCALYHVTARGNERRAIFRDEKDRQVYLSRLAFYREKFGFQLFAYCLMTNHVHLAIRTGVKPLSKIMAGLHATYAQSFNRRHERVGHLFQGRYKAFLVQEDRYLLALLRYIHLNPVRARLALHPREYRWSSDQFFRSGRGPEWLDLDRLFALIGTSRRAAISRYVALIDETSQSTPYEDLDVVERVVVGDEAFAAERLQADGLPDPPPKTLSLNQVLEFVARETRVPTAAIAGPGRDRASASARRLAAYLARRVCRISVRRVAHRLGRDESSFVRPLARLEKTLLASPDARERIESLVEKLRQVKVHRPPARSNKSRSQD